MNNRPFPFENSRNFDNIRKKNADKEKCKQNAVERIKKHHIIKNSLIQLHNILIILCTLLSNKFRDVKTLFFFRLSGNNL